MLCCIMVSNVLCGMLYLNITSFYPLFTIDNYGENISVAMIAFAMCSFELSGFIFSPVHAATISKMGRKNAILIGISILLSTNTVMGFLSFVDPSKWKLFFGLSIAIRFV